RVTPAGEGFVLHQAAKREVTTVAVAPDGTIYAAAVGNRQQPSATPSIAPLPVAGGSGAGSGPAVARPNQPGPLTITPNPPAVTGGSEIYHILPDGYPRKVWSHAQDLVYAIAFDGQGRPVVATGNHGTVYRIDSDHAYTRLLTLEPTQVTAMTVGPAGGAI